MPYTTEFPDFDPATMPAIPCGFDDVSWHNDTCPSFQNEALRLMIFVDYADTALRELSETPRFTLRAVADDISDDADIISTDDWQEILTHILARAFADNIESAFTADELAECKRRNATADYDGGSCATHDFCDANMNMLDSFVATFGREPSFLPDSDDETDLRIWNRAWNIAKAEYLTAK